MKKVVTKLFSLMLSMILFNSCLIQKSPDESSSLLDAGTGATFMLVGDIVVTNYTGDSALLLDSSGNYKAMLYNVANNEEQVLGLGWSAPTSEIIITVNGVPDRIIGISAIDGTERTIVQSIQFNGNPYGVTVDAAGDILAIETHQVEKFDINGLRYNDATFPTGTLFNNLAQINSLAAGGFVVCGYGGDLVATYDDTVTQTFSTTSGIASTTNGYGCAELPDGSIAATWDGSTDSLVVYDNTLSSILASYNDNAILANPRGIAIKANGNILVADYGYHYILEFSYDAGAGTLTYVQSLGGGLLSSPWQVLEIPTF